MFCNNCGAEIADRAVICVKCGVANSPVGALDRSSKSRTVFVVLGVIPLTGVLGIHDFYAGRTGLGVVHLLTFWLVPLSWIWAVIEVCTVTKDGQGKQLS